jgi:hypothetical protein
VEGWAEAEEEVVVAVALLEVVEHQVVLQVVVDPEVPLLLVVLVGLRVVPQQVPQ